VLLDFGTSRPVAKATAAGYLALLRAMIDGRRDDTREAAFAAGFVGPGAIAHHRMRIDRMIDIVIAKLRRLDAFVGVRRDEGIDVAADPSAWHIPPAEILFAQLKISGSALLAARLKA
jgi:hypothetical protein